MKRSLERIALVLFGVVLALSVPSVGHRRHQTPRCPSEDLTPRSGYQEVRRFVVCMAKVTPNVSPEKAVSTFSCESGLNPRAYNASGPYGGVGQQLLPRWDERSARYGFAGHPWYDPVANATVSIRMARDSGWGHWPDCGD